MGIHRLTFLSSYWDKVAANLPDALINTVVGIVVVFVALIFISLVISLFKQVSVFEAGLAERKAKKTQTQNASALAAEAAERTMQQIAEIEEEDLSSDLELVAVITAAIYAYEQSQGNMVTDGLYVRSIRKSKKSNWQKA